MDRKTRSGEIAENPADNQAMAIPWLRLLDAAIGVTDLARSRRIRSLATDNEPRDVAETQGGRAPGAFEARLAGVLVGALKEVFDRDTHRLDLEREQMDAERRRAERALQLELLRQAADREIARLRLIAGLDVVVWLGSLAFAVRATLGMGAKLTLGGGWLLLFAAIAASFSGQSSIARGVERERTPSDGAGFVALWMTIVGLALVAISVLV